MAEISVILAPGFEEIEALAPVDIWRRCGLKVELCGLNAMEICGAHGITVIADRVFSGDECSDALFLPGGMPGSTNLRDDEKVVELVRDFYGQQKIVSAICAAPMVLSAAGLLSKARFTMYPGMTGFLRPGECPTANLVEICGNIVTGKGAGAAPHLAREVASLLGCDVSGVLAGMFLEV